MLDGEKREESRMLCLSSSEGEIPLTAVVMLGRESGVLFLKFLAKRGKN